LELTPQAYTIGFIIKSVVVECYGVLAAWMITWP
jgi:hypothetical protein